jgi:hypothetical protein
MTAGRGPPVGTALVPIVGGPAFVARVETARHAVDESEPAMVSTTKKQRERGGASNIGVS